MPIVWVGLWNSVIPWSLLAYAVLSLEAGLTSLLNAATPLFAAVLGYVWLRIPLTLWQISGLLVGIVGVTVLAGDVLQRDAKEQIVAMVATLVAAACYGYVGHFVKRNLAGVSPKSITVGNLASATVILTPLAAFHLPTAFPSGMAMLCTAALAVFSTALAFLLLFDVLARCGATATSTVTFVIPIFGVLFGAVFLQEAITPVIVTGMMVALSGAALTTGLIPPKGGIAASKAS
ncbi:MAG: DMT family transporter [Verrucomicrobiota bacterium]